MFNFKVFVLFAVLIHCILSMPTGEQDAPSDMPEADVKGDMDTAEHHYRGWGGYYRPYYGGYYGGYRGYYGHNYYYPRYHYWG